MITHCTRTGAMQHGVIYLKRTVSNGKQLTKACCAQHAQHTKQVHDEACRLSPVSLQLLCTSN